ncbi:uncharacterized protein N7496_006579 [Penicillium cataractarum]|uniref:Uncharacterized protein n=1 Tax=Penicillium cataractarum TaxID=2100454 RepID=A0A9W9S2I8_9EURO|nr:uncharacterized protein N7496_006579 [Penicillium cataractarum]KAJ5370487.1 hypothetical protein N7496_006579 [Penicillium cataractarum]
MNSTTCVIEANPDVSGTGIRASIYALCLGGTLVSYFLRVFSPGEDEEEFSRGVSSALGMQGLALLCTAIYQTFRNELTLFHAICVVHLLALLGLNLISKGRYAGFGPWRLWFFALIQVISLGAFIAFNVYLWVTAPHFGSQPACNPDTVYVVFGVSIHATSPVFRYIILGTLGASAAGFILVFTCMLPCICGAWIRRRRDSQGNGGLARKRGCTKWFIQTSTSADHQSNHQREELAGQVLLNFTLNRAAYIGLCIYLIVSLEQTIQRNTLDPQEKGWTFGQVIAIFLLLGVANELLNVVLASWDRRIGHEAGSQELAQVRPASSSAASRNSLC